MANRKKILIPIIIVVAIAIAVFFIVACTDRPVTYHSAEIYTQQQFYDEEMVGKKVSSSGGYARHFLPEYEGIEYNYSSVDFYIYDGTTTLTRTAVTFALDLQFDDENDYLTAKQSELSANNFMTEYNGDDLFLFEAKPETEFSYGDFTCKIVENADYPRRCGIICFNDEDYVLRYLYYDEWEAPEQVPQVDYIVKCTNCPWD